MADSNFDNLINLDKSLPGLQEIISGDMFESNGPGSELDSVIAVLERHGKPLVLEQVRSLEYAKYLCPGSEIIQNLSKALDSGRYKAIDPKIFLEALSMYTLADRVTGRIPLAKAFSGGDSK